jgi:hypothetical protein
LYFCNLLLCLRKQPVSARSFFLFFHSGRFRIICFALKKSGCVHKVCTFRAHLQITNSAQRVAKRNSASCHKITNLICGIFKLINCFFHNLKIPFRTKKTPYFERKNY